jgi:ribosomal protein L16/L10AE
MGKGKGEIKEVVCKVPAGKLLFDIRMKKPMNKTRYKFIL